MVSSVAGLTLCIVFLQLCFIVQGENQFIHDEVSQLLQYQSGRFIKAIIGINFEFNVLVTA